MSLTVKQSALAPASADSDRLLGARRNGFKLRDARKEGSRERASDLGGLRLQMHVDGHIEGYHLYWANDDNGEVEQLLQEDFDFVMQDELYSHSASTVVEDIDISSVMSRFVKGTRTDGGALRAFLLKTPEENWAAREQQRYDAADKWDREIKKQAEPEAGSGLRKLPGHETKVDTGFKKSY